MKKRSYTSETREAQAAQTKLCVLEAARRLFQSEGFDRVTIQQLAKEANIAVPTVYAIFKSKRGVLQALIDHSLPPDKREALVEESMQEKSAKKRLAVTAKLSRQLYDAEREFMDILRGASVVSSELRELEQEREKRRYERQGEYTKKLKKDLAKGLTLNKARDILWALTGRDLYRMLVIEKNWTSNAYEKWLADVLVKALLEDNGG